ncbi:hypothetical protein BaRGS_00028962 [Batillaria attramentaria]|uniref:Uncharacterized protein n=1 Tax=Batillaria attramentaria TaxID=370345 RepID=A0ABD0JXK5_9CAEN
MEATMELVSFKCKSEFSYAAEPSGIPYSLRVNTFTAQNSRASCFVVWILSKGLRSLTVYKITNTDHDDSLGESSAASASFVAGGSKSVHVRFRSDVEDEQTLVQTQTP